MKVYVVVETGSGEIHGVFATAVRAKGYCYRYNRHRVPKEFEISEHELKGFDNVA